MKRALCWLTACFCLGVISAQCFGLPFLPLYALLFIAVFLCLILLRRGFSFEAILLFLWFVTGATLLAGSKILPLNHISRLPLRGEVSLLRGYICEEPLLKNGRATFILQARELRYAGKGYFCRGKVLVRVKGKGNLRFGDSLALKGKILRIFYSKNHNQRSLMPKGIHCFMYARSCILLKQRRLFSFSPFAALARDYASRKIFGYSSAACAGLISAMVLGQKNLVAPAIRDLMARSGTVHILVVSGFHVGLAVFLIMLLLKIIRIPRRLRIIIALPLMIIYCLIAGAAISVVRATIMAAVFLFSYPAKREADAYNSCALAALLILLVNPNQLFDIGFQLSFASVISIVFFYPKIKNRFMPQRIGNRFIGYLMEGLAVSFSAWLGTAAFILYYFKLFSPVAILANIFVVPLAALVAFGGFATVIFSLIMPDLAFYLAKFSGLAAALMVNISALLLKIPFACVKIG